MKKSAFLYSIAFAVGQLFAPAVSYSQYQNVPDRPRAPIDKSERSDSVTALNNYQTTNPLYKNVTACPAGTSANGAGNCVNTTTGETTQDFLVKPPEDASSATQVRTETTTDNSSTGGGTAATGVPSGTSLDNDMKDQQLDSAKIQAAMAQITAAFTNGTAVGGQFPTYQAIQAAHKKYMTDKPTCVSRHSSAASACLEHLSPQILTGVTTLNSILSTVGSAAVNDSCSTFAKAMDLAKVAMTGYTAACGTMKAGCGLSCVSARSALTTIQKSVASNPTPYVCAGVGETRMMCNAAAQQYVAGLNALNAAVTEELNAAEKKSMAGKASLCTEKYAQLITSGLSGIMSLVNSAKQGNKCDKQTAATETDACKIIATANTEACLCKVETSQACICLRNPRLPGCASGLAEANQSSNNNYAGLGANDKTNAATNAGSDLTGLDGSGLGIQQAERNPTSAGGAPPPTGGGSGIGGGGGGSGGGSDGGPGAKKGLNANILGGASGGGGGGWGGGGGGASAANSKYRSYLPGGANDPNKGMAGQAWMKEVTGQGGKSNFEKVKDRYRDNKNSLLNN